MIFIPVFHAGNHGIAPILGTKRVFFSFGPDEFWNNTNETAAEASFEMLSRIGDAWPRADLERNMTRIEKDSGRAKLCAIAEKAAPGWKAVTVARRVKPVGANMPKADVAGLDLAALKRKYLGLTEKAVGRAKSGQKRDDDAHFVTLSPSQETESPIRARAVIVTGKKVVGYQG